MERLEWKKMPSNGFVPVHQVAVGPDGTEYSIWQRRVGSRIKKTVETTLRIGRAKSESCINTADAKTRADFLAFG